MKYYVYCHFRADNNQLFYVGKGSGKRAFLSSKRNKYWHNVVNKCNGFTVEILAKELTEKEALVFERKIIQTLKAKYGDFLVNLTEGGDGGLNPSKETRQKQSNAKLGRRLTQETKDKIKQSLVGNKRSLGFKQTAETIEKRRKTVTGTKRTKEACENISKAKKQKNFKHSLETKLKISLTKRLKKEQQNDNDISAVCK
jgi:hypothetical protein